MQSSAKRQVNLKKMLIKAKVKVKIKIKIKIGNCN